MCHFLTGELGLSLLSQSLCVAALPLMLEVLFEQLPHHGSDNLIRNLLQLINVLVLLLIVDWCEALVTSIVESSIR